MFLLIYENGIFKKEIGKLKLQAEVFKTKSTNFHAPKLIYNIHFVHHYYLIVRYSFKRKDEGREVTSLSTIEC